VNIRITKPASRGKKSEALIIKIIKRTEEPLVCLCKKKYKTGELIALPYRSTVTIPIKLTGRKEKLRNGDIIMVKITSGIERPM
jgi:hypothetical protein